MASTTALLEIACFSSEAASMALEAGANRIEFCTNRDLGGTTPSDSTVNDTLTLATQKNIPVFIMIRPRGGDFIYSAAEFQMMRDDIKAQRHRANGFVFGVLTEDQSVDVQRTKELVGLADGLPCTFHRAFDEVVNWETGLEDVIEVGCRGILTSGGAKTAVEGQDVLRQLVEKARGRIEIIVGGGVRSSNFGALVEATGAKAYHSAAILDGQELPSGAEVRLLKGQICENTGLR